jgi:F0F1-type ATP synthase membrane subunit b/b'
VISQSLIALVSLVAGGLATAVAIALFSKVRQAGRERREKISPEALADAQRKLEEMQRATIEYEKISADARKVAERVKRATRIAGGG